MVRVCSSTLAMLKQSFFMQKFLLTLAKLRSTLTYIANRGVMKYKKRYKEKRIPYCPCLRISVHAPAVECIR